MTNSCSSYDSWIRQFRHFLANDSRSIHQICQSAGVSNSTIYLWLHGCRSINLDTFLDFTAEAFNLEGGALKEYQDVKSWQEWIRRKMRKNKITFSSLALCIGYHPSTVSRWLSSAKVNPGIVAVFKINQVISAHASPYEKRPCLADTASLG